MPTSPYTREVLAEAARTSRTLSEALTKLGVDPQSPSRIYLRERMKRLDVDTSHFEREGRRWTRETLEAAVAASTTMYEVLRRLGLDAVGGQHTHISRRVKALGIDTSHFTPHGRGGRRAGQAPLSPEELLVEQDPSSARRVQRDRLRKAMLLVGLEERCSSCDTGPNWRGRPLSLEVDHIDGDWRNNRIENLRFLCPNCHSVTDNYRGNRRGRGRHAA
ncbi:HNH endonuclease signature motif containing protein [Streptomyces sp. HNM0663]|uniref:HNH endonuclease signature motif containing protein n=1 Tax=Streptomyces chengmaiensis TaxID=3040919 RepID=A0ABT6HQ58_9ACTN|nr:HNH endonuclease signature motif containing protein [Streptomyces chengmaiensis]MDH2390475.1 HNH endonuclease signature motif containing protein [Streptomyces chengmaiensis]